MKGVADKSILMPSEYVSHITREANLDSATSKARKLTQGK